MGGYESVVRYTDYLKGGYANVLKEITRHAFPNLQRLGIAVESFELGLLVKLASQLPQLVSLSMKFGTCKMVLFENSVGMLKLFHPKYSYMHLSLKSLQYRSG